MMIEEESIEIGSMKLSKLTNCLNMIEIHYQRYNMSKLGSGYIKIAAAHM